MNNPTVIIPPKIRISEILCTDDERREIVRQLAEMRRLGENLYIYGVISGTAQEVIEDEKH